MIHVAVVGIGSAHGADRAGWQAIDALQRTALAERFDGTRVSLRKCRAPTELYQLLETCQFAVLIDAVPGRVGQLSWLDLADIQQRARPSSVHGVGAGDMLALLQTLAPTPPAVAVLGIGVETGSEASPLDTLSAPALCCLRGRVEQAIRRFLHTAGLPQKNVSEEA